MSKRRSSRRLSQKVSDNETASIEEAVKNVTINGRPRRSTRKAENETYQDPPDLESPKKARSRRSSISTTVKRSNANGEISNTYFAKELEAVAEVTEKPPDLFEDEDVDGKEMYGLGTPSKSSASSRKSIILQKGHDLKSAEIKIPKISLQKDAKTGNYNIKDPDSKNSMSVAHTNPNRVRSTRSMGSVKSQCNVTQSKMRNESGATNGLADSDNKENNKMKSENVPEDPKDGFSSRVLRPRKATVQDHYFNSDDFFGMHAEKSRTSKNTLNKLKNRHLDEESLRKLLEKTDYIPMEHKLAIRKLTIDLKREYSEWLHVMKEGFNILLYGLGSKRLLINDFFKEMIRDEPTLIVNGFFPSLTLKEILDDIIVTLLGLQTVSSQSECFNIIEKTMNSHPDRCIYLLIHNIDGGMLRSSKTQDVLSRLASIPNVHLVASVDHINAPLIWDNVKRERFNFYWITATTFLPYEAETSYEGSLLVQKSGALALMSLQNVFASLTPNAKSIYILLVKYQLESTEKSQSGMAFKELYRAAREGFLVSSDQALRSQLTEFIDHKLVRQKRNADSIETLQIPLDNSLLKQFLELYEEKSK